MDITLVDQAKEIERRREQALLDDIDRFDEGIGAVRKQLKKLKNLKKQTIIATEQDKIRVKNLLLDVSDAHDRLTTVRLKLKEFDRHIGIKNTAFKLDVENIENTKVSLHQQQLYVAQQIKELNNTSVEFEFNNCFTRKLCQTSRDYNYTVYKRWLTLFPLFQMYLSNESKIHTNIYNSAMLEGMTEEMMSHFESKLNILKFQEKFKHYSDEELGQLRDHTNSILIEEQNARSRELDHMHYGMHTRIRSANLLCESLYADISEREELRRELNAYVMEMSNVLESDFIASMDNTEKIAAKPLGEIMNEIRDTEQRAEKRDNKSGAGGGGPNPSSLDDYNRALFSGGTTPINEMLVSTPGTSTRANTRYNAHAQGREGMEGIDFEEERDAMIGSSLEEDAGGAHRPRTIEMIENLISRRYQWYINHHSNVKYSRVYKYCHSEKNNNALEQMCKQIHNIYPGIGILPLNAKTRLRNNKNEAEDFTDYSRLASINEEVVDLPMTGSMEFSAHNNPREVVPILPTDITEIRINSEYSTHSAANAPRKPSTRPPTDKSVRANLSIRQKAAAAAASNNRNKSSRGDDDVSHATELSVPASTDPQRPSSPQEDFDEMDHYSSMFASLSEELNKYDNVIENVLSFNAAPLDVLEQLKPPSVHQLEPMVNKAFAGINQTQASVYASLSDVSPDVLVHYKQVAMNAQYATAALSYDVINKVSDALEAAELARATTDEHFEELTTVQMQRHTAQQQKLIELVKENEERVEAAKSLFQNARHQYEDWLTRSIAHNYKSAVTNIELLMPQLNLYTEHPEGPSITGIAAASGAVVTGVTPGGYMWDEYGSYADGFEHFEDEEGGERGGSMVQFSGLGGVGVDSMEEHPHRAASPPMKRAPKDSEDLTVKNVLDISSSLLNQINSTLHMYGDGVERHNSVVHGNFTGAGGQRQPSPPVRLGTTGTGSGAATAGNSGRESPFLGESTNVAGSQNGESAGGVGHSRGGKLRQSIITINKEQEQIRRVKSQEEEQAKDISSVPFDVDNPILPKTDQVLATMETIMNGELYVISFTWLVKQNAVKLTARCHISKVDFKEYSLVISALQLCGVAGCYSYSIMLNQLFNETPKFCQTLIYHIKIEFIDPVYYDIVTKALIGAGSASNNYKFDVNKMLIPDYQVEATTPRPYEYLLAVLILRKKDSYKMKKTAIDKGNYRGYYKLRGESDGRVNNFRHDWFNGKVCLDIGCNEGTVTMEIAQKYSPRCILGIDIDRILIESAQSKLKRAVYEQTKIASSSSQSTTPVYAFIPRAVLQKNQNIAQTIKQQRATQEHFPYNAHFVCKSINDISSGSNQTQFGKYDTIVCLSVVKWIHLNEGDAGLLAFFQKVYNVLHPDGLFILEFQPWKSYLNNKSVNEHIKANFTSIKLRPEDFEGILEGIGFVLEQNIGCALSESKGFNRPIYILRKSVSSSINGGSGSVHASSVEKSSDAMEEEIHEVAVSAIVVSDVDAFQSFKMTRDAWMNEVDWKEEEEQYQQSSKRSRFN